jgi:hypothetical protein
MNKNTLIGGALLLGVLIWSMTMSTNQANDAARMANKQKQSLLFPGC